MTCVGGDQSGSVVGERRRDHDCTSLASGRERGVAYNDAPCGGCHANHCTEVHVYMRCCLPCAE